MKQIDFTFFLFNNQSNKLQIFTGVDIIVTFIWLIIAISICIYIKSANKEKEHYVYFMRNFYFKLTLGLIFAFYFIYFVQGGDTLAYWDASIRLTNLLYENPNHFFIEWGQVGNQPDYINFFSIKTGYPPGWIQREPEGYYVSKLISLINLLTFGSYFANTVIFSLFSAIASFKLYDFVVSFGIHDYRKLALYFLFIPSLAFWCSGLSKDTIIMICLYTSIPLLFNLMSGNAKIKIFNILVILLLVYILNNIRSFMILCLVGPFFFAFNVRLLNKYIENRFVRRVLNTLILSVGMAFGSVYFGAESAQKYLTEAEVIQKDFQNNPLYTGKKYDLGIVEFTPVGMLKTMPLALLTGIYRPFPWEALSPGLILNAIESIILFYLTFVFMIDRRGKRMERIRNTDILTYAVYFVFLMAFMTGFTSIIFGVLVRLRAPLLPFFIMLLTVQPIEAKSTSETEGNEEDKKDMELDSGELSTSYS
jgi:hypothetical protein